MGWQIVVPTEHATDTEHLNFVPTSVAQKFAYVDKHDKIITKDRLAHDCSQSSASGQSINNMIDDKELEECKFGSVLIQIIHNIHLLSHQFPDTKIFMNKYDLDTAYCRLSVVAQFVVMCTIAVQNFTYICFWLCFGAKPAPGLFSIVNKFIAELAEYLTEDETWNPHTLQSNMLNDINTTPVLYKGKFATTQPLLFDWTAKPLSIRVFIDDMITLVIDNATLIYQAIHPILLILDSIFRPNLPGEPMSRNPILSQKKLKEEGILSAQQVILRWLINTRMLKLFIIKDKACRILIELKDMVK